MGRHPKIAAERQFQTAAKRRAIDGHHGHRREFFQPVKEPVHRPDIGDHVLNTAVGLEMLLNALEVGPGAENLLGAANQNDGRRSGLDVIQRSVKFGQKAVIDRIYRWCVQNNVTDISIFNHFYHRTSPSPFMPSASIFCTLNFCIFPLGVLGSASQHSTRSGILNLATPCATSRSYTS